jgi:4-hydroxyphenylacetate 3-monooxygenase
MMHVKAFVARRSAAFAPELAVGTHEIDHGSAGLQLYQAVFLAVSLDATTEYVAIELNGPRQIADTQHDVVETANLEYGHERAPWFRELRDAAPIFETAQVSRVGGIAPWERVFVHDNAEMSREVYVQSPSHCYGNHQSNVRFWAKMGLLTGVLGLFARSTGAPRPTRWSSRCCAS